MLEVTKIKNLKFYESEARRPEKIPEHSGVILIDFQRSELLLEDFFAVAVTVLYLVPKRIFQLYKLSG